MKESANLRSAVQLGAFFFEAADADHLLQQRQRMIGVDVRGHDVWFQRHVLQALQRRGVTFGESEFASLEQPAHDFSAPRLRYVSDKFDLLWSDHRTQAFARKAEQVAAELFARCEGRLQRDECFHDFTRHWVRLADDTGLRDRRMLHQGALHFKRPNQMTGGFDDVVGTTDEPEVAVTVAFGEIARQVPSAGEAFAIALFLVQIAAKHRRPARSQREFAFDARFANLLDAAVFITANESRLDTGKGPAHRARTNIHRGVVRNHDAASLGLPPVVMNRKANRLFSPYYRFGLEWFSDAGDEAQTAKIIFANHLGADLHHHAHRGRRRVPDGDLLILNQRVPSLGIELRLVDDAGDAVGERRDDPV